MKRLILAAGLALAGCNGGIASIPTAPAEVADRTILDEKALTGIELAYKASRLAVEAGVDLGVIKGATASRFAVLDSKAYDAVTLARKAYGAGNARSYEAAVTEAQSAVADLLALTGK